LEDPQSNRDCFGSGQRSAGGWCLGEDRPIVRARFRWKRSPVAVAVEVGPGEDVVRTPEAIVTMEDNWTACGDSYKRSARSGALILERRSSSRVASNPMGRRLDRRIAPPAIVLRKKGTLKVLELSSAFDRV